MSNRINKRVAGIRIALAGIVSAGVLMLLFCSGCSAKKEGYVISVGPDTYGYTQEFVFDFENRLTEYRYDDEKIHFYYDDDNKWVGISKDYYDFDTELADNNYHFSDEEPYPYKDEYWVHEEKKVESYYDEQGRLSGYKVDDGYNYTFSYDNNNNVIKREKTNSKSYNVMNCQYDEKLGYCNHYEYINGYGPDRLENVSVKNVYDITVELGDDGRISKYEANADYKEYKDGELSHQEQAQHKCTFSYSANTPKEVIGLKYPFSAVYLETPLDMLILNKN